MQRNAKIAVILTILGVLIIGMGVSYAGDHGDKTVEAEVLEFDFFHNAKLDTTFDDLQKIGVDYGDDLLATLGDQSLVAVMARDYNGIASYEGFVVWKNSEIMFGVFNYQLQKMMTIKEGDVVTISKIGRNPYADKIPNYSKKYSSDPDDFPSMEVFSNFRMVDEGEVTPGLLYRSASPWTSGNRAPYADEFYRENGVDCLICMDASYETIAKYVDEHPDYYASELFKQGKVICGEYETLIHSFPEQTKKFMDTFLESEGSIGIFCKLGRDRTGLYCAILEGLAGASYQEIRDDYMESICNYFGIVKDSEEYKVILDMYTNREFFLFNHYEQVPSIPNIKWRDLEYIEYDPEAVFTKYLIDYVGMDADKVQAVKDKLEGMGF